MIVNSNDHLAFTSPLTEELPAVSIRPKYHVVDNYFDNRYLTLHSSFTPSDKEEEDEIEQAFYKNAYERPKDFIYGGLSVYERFQHDFDTIAALESELEQADVDDEDELETAIEIAKTTLQENIKIHFLEFLQAELGHEELDHDRTHLVPEILYRLSRKATTSLIAQLNGYTIKNFSSILSGPSPKRQKIELCIPPKESDEPVKIISITNPVLENQLALQRNSVKLDAEIQLVAKGVFSIPLQGQTQADIELSLGV